MFDSTEYRGLIETVDNAQTNHEKGQSLENLTSYLLGGLDGVEVRERNIVLPTEEIDILLWNAKLEQVLVPWDEVILVECKNWSAPVGASILRSFLHKVHEKHLKTGIFIAANGVTGDFENGNDIEIGAARLLYDSLIRDNLRVIVLRMRDLREMNNLDDFRELIKSRYCKLYMKRIF